MQLALLGLGAVPLLPRQRIRELGLQLVLAALERLAVELRGGGGGGAVAEGQVAEATLRVVLEAGEADAEDLAAALEEAADVLLVRVGRVVGDEQGAVGGRRDPDGPVAEVLGVAQQRRPRVVGAAELDERHRLAVPLLQVDVVDVPILAEELLDLGLRGVGGQVGDEHRRVLAVPLQLLAARLALGPLVAAVGLARRDLALPLRARRAARVGGIRHGLLLLLLLLLLMMMMLLLLLMMIICGRTGLLLQLGGLVRLQGLALPALSHALARLEDGVVGLPEGLGVLVVVAVLQVDLHDALGPVKSAHLEGAREDARGKGGHAQALGEGGWRRAARLAPGGGEDYHLPEVPVEPEVVAVGVQGHLRQLLPDGAGALDVLLLLGEELDQDLLEAVVRVALVGLAVLAPAPVADVLEGRGQADLGHVDVLLGGAGVHGGALEVAAPGRVHLEDAGHAVAVELGAVGGGVLDALDVGEGQAGLLGGQDVAGPDGAGPGDVADGALQHVEHLGHQVGGHRGAAGLEVGVGGGDENGEVEPGGLVRGEHAREGAREEAEADLEVGNGVAAVAARLELLDLPVEILGHDGALGGHVAGLDGLGELGLPGVAQLVEALGVAGVARHLLHLGLVGVAVVLGQEAREHLGGGVPRGMGHDEAVLEEVRDAAHAGLGGGAAEQLHLERDPAVPELVAVREAELDRLVALLPQVEGGVEGEGLAADVLLVGGPAGVAAGLAVGVERPEVLAVGDPHAEAAGLGERGAAEGLDDAHAALEVGGPAPLLVEVLEPVVLPHRVRHGASVLSAASRHRTLERSGKDARVVWLFFFFFPLSAGSRGWRAACGLRAES